MENEIYHNPNWFVVYTKPRCEKKLKQSLEKAKIQTFLPLLKQRRRWSDRWKIIEFPAFSSYLFVKIVYSTEFQKVLADKNSVCIVHFAGKPAIVAEEDIELLKIFLTEYPEKIKLQELEKLQTGKLVKIKHGPFAGRSAVVEKIKNSVYIVLNLPAVGKTLKLEIKKEDLELDE